MFESASSVAVTFHSLPQNKIKDYIKVLVRINLLNLVYSQSRKLVNDIAHEYFSNIDLTFHHLS